MEPIETARMQLIPLTLAQLREFQSVSPVNGGELGLPPRKSDLEVQPGLRLAEGVLSESALRAIGVKVMKMREFPEAMHPWFTYWLLILPLERLAIGMAGFKGHPDEKGEAEIGYGIAPAYQNHGLMTEAVEALVAWALAQPVCKAVIAQTLKSNLASQRVLEKVGFTRQPNSNSEIRWKISRPSDPGVPTGWNK